MYVSLHNRSAYSFGSSLVQPELLAEFAANHDMPAIALTDRDRLYAAIAFQQACAAAGVKPIYGVETDLASGPSVTLLAQTLAGYANLCRLASLRHLRETPLTIHDVAGHAAGLVCLVGRWPAMRPAVTPVAAQPADWADPLRQAFDHRLYIELFIHGPADTSIARRRAQWADEQALPVVAYTRPRGTSPTAGSTLAIAGLACTTPVVPGTSQRTTRPARSWAHSWPSWRRPSSNAVVVI